MKTRSNKNKGTVGTDLGLTEERAEELIAKVLEHAKADDNVAGIIKSIIDDKSLNEVEKALCLYLLGGICGYITRNAGESPGL